MFVYRRKDSRATGLIFLRFDLRSLHYNRAIEY